MNNEFQKKLRYYLIAANAALLVIAVIVASYWALIIRPSRIDKAKDIGQYHTYSLDKLPNFNHEIAEKIIPPKQTDQRQLLEQELAKIDLELDAAKKQAVIANAKEILSHPNNQPNNSKPTSSLVTHKRPQIAIIVTNLGLRECSLDKAIQLPKPVAIGFVPYTKHLIGAIERAQAQGRETYLYLPLQTAATDNIQDPYSLHSAAPSEQNILKFYKILASQRKYKGVYTSYQEIFTSNYAATQILLEAIADKKLLFILGAMNNQHLTKYMAEYNKIIPTSLVIDELLETSHITQNLAKLVNIAKQEGKALAYAQGSSLTIDILRNWLGTLPNLGVELVPVSSLAQN